ncbi:hypothetical protein N7528_003051 [Penicillium herquei]|nr:hypothetical protein N7528_003051 [Penicillium herquei]
MKAAIAAGGDVNELDHAPDPRRSCGRPLDMAVKEDDCNWADLKRNIPVIQLLLAHGADPRLEGVLGAPSPLDYARHRATDYPPPEPEEMQLFYKTVYMLLRDAAKRLDGPGFS